MHLGYELPNEGFAYYLQARGENIRKAESAPSLGSTHSAVIFDKQETFSLKDHYPEMGLEPEGSL